MENKKKRIAVFQVQIDELKSLPEFPEYTHALILFKYNESLLAHKIFELINCKVDILELKDFVKSLSFKLWQKKSAELFEEDLQETKPSVSVIVCTRNRTEDLEKCLNSLIKINYPEYEILVIDNAPSNSSTRNLVRKYPGVKYVYEEIPGLDFARNTGIEESTGEIIAFTDDDAAVDPNWLQKLVRNFSDPLTAAVTGITMPIELENEAQIIFEETNGFGRGYERKEYDFVNTNPIAAGKIGAGVNMAIRRSLLSEIGLFDEHLDCGTLTLSGGDQEFFYRILKRGFRIVYEPDALVWHRHRSDMQSLENTFYSYGAGVFAWWTRALFKEKEFKLIIFGTLWFFNYHVKNLLRSIFKRKNSIALNLSFAEFRGALTGSYRYFKSLKDTEEKLRLIEKENSGSESDYKIMNAK